MKKISVIIPVYNGEKYIRECLDSIINAIKIIDNEIIIINDCSTDDTKSICEEYKKQYNNVKLINLIENKGVSNARNIGIENAIGDYIQFVDSDDTIKQNMYSELLKQDVLYKYDLIIFGANYIYSNNQVQDVSIYNGKCINKKDISEFLYNVHNSNKPRILNVIWNKIYSRKIIEENSIRFNSNINLGEDFLFNCQYFKRIQSLIEQNKIYYNYYVRNTDSLSTKFRIDVIERRKLIYETLLDLYKSYNIYDESKKIEFEKIEGYLMYHSFYSIFKKECTLNEQEKIKFLKNMLNYKYINTVITYLKSSKKNKIELRFILNKNEIKLYKYMKIKVNLKKLIKNIITIK